MSPDWAAILAAGVQQRIAQASAAYAPLVDAGVCDTASRLPDPLEEIA